jgi:hypothetical protein
MRRNTKKTVVSADVFPRFHTHVSWRQRWHYGTGHKGVLNKHELPLTGTQVDHHGARRRVNNFRTLFHTAMADIATVLEQARAVLRRGRK